MDWNDWLRILRWRALEEGDADGALLSEERRREATAHSRGGLTSDEVKGEPLMGREVAFLAKRADLLEHEMMGWSGSLVRLMERLDVVRGRWSWALLGWLLALVLGYSLSGFGQEAEFNLLALPLVAVLLWNAVVMLAALIWEFLPAANRADRKKSGLLAWLEQRLTPSSRDNATEADTATGVGVDQRFAMLAAPLASERLQRRLRAWLHVAAALLALGSAAGLYARGWSKEYRAVWESTLLTERTATQFFGSLFAPASRVLKLEIPLEAIPRMHRTGGMTESPAPALPWIHLYAGTLFLLVMVPRFGLAGLTLLRSKSLLQRRVRSLAWRTYLIRTLRAVEGGHEKITVLIHGTDATPTQREMWSRGVRERFGSLVTPEMMHVSLGDEDEFVAEWNPATPRVLIVFSLATTPEAEVQRRFVADVRQSLLARQSEAELLILLDATSIGNRWSPDKVAGRERLWTDMMQGVADEVIIAARKASNLPA
jgi:hypothetical protein